MQNALGFLWNKTSSWTNSNQEAIKPQAKIVRSFIIPSNLILEKELISLFFNFENEKIDKVYSQLEKSFKEEDPYSDDAQDFGTCSMSSIWGWLKYCFRNNPQVQVKELRIGFLRKNIKDLIYINYKYIRNKFKYPELFNQYQLKSKPAELNQPNLEKVIAFGSELYERASEKKLEDLGFEEQLYLVT